MATVLFSPTQPGAAEERIRGEIAYYKARLVDICNAPETSRHRAALNLVTERLRHRETLLAHLHGSHCNG